MLLAGCLGKGGAVSVRWRIDELSTGAFIDPRGVAGSDGECCQVRDKDNNCCPVDEAVDEVSHVCCAFQRVDYSGSAPRRACCAAVDAATGCAAVAPVHEWRISRVRVVLDYPDTEKEIDDAPSGLDAKCGDRELTTPFTLPEGLFAITLRAYNPAAPDQIQAESPSPAIREIKKSEIVNLDVVELSVTQ
jgi:hypothetical protein